MKASIRAIDEQADRDLSLLDRVAPQPERRAPIPFESESAPTPWPNDCLPDGMREAAEAIAEHVAAPVALAGMAVLAGVAHIAMRLGDAQHPKTGAMPCSLYILTQAKSGDRKSECFRLATAPVEKHERKQREDHKAALKELNREAAKAKPKEAKLILADAPPDPRTIFKDTTTQRIEQEFINGSAPALSLLTDEGAILMGGHSLKSDTRAGNLGTLTRLFDGSGVDRARIGEGQSGFRFGVRFGLFLSAQPVVLHEALSDPLLRDQGFLPRFLFGAPSSLAGTRFLTDGDLVRRAGDDPRIVDYWRSLQRLVEHPVVVDEHWALNLQPVGMEQAAITHWLGFYNDTEARQGRGGDLEHLGAFASRVGELVARVAAVFALWRCCSAGNAPTFAKVTAEDMRGAAALVGYSLAEWQRQGTRAILSDTERAARDLLDWLHRKKLSEVTRTYLAQSGPNSLRKDRRLRDDAISELLARHWLREDGADLRIAKKQNGAPANANSANPANGQQVQVSELSRVSSSNPTGAKIDSDDLEAFDL